MSGVFIVGIEMPEIGTVNMEVVKHDDKYFIGPCGKNKWFQLIPVPDHGRLIDADALYEQFMNVTPAIFTKKEFEIVCPTIIPADKEEIP